MTRLDYQHCSGKEPIKVSLKIETRALFYYYFFECTLKDTLTAKNILRTTTSFPASLSSASLGRWEKDPGCSWSHDNL